MGWWLGAGIGIGMGIVGTVLAIRRRYLVVTVDGMSMHPTLTDGDRVLVRRGATRPPRRGNVVVLRPPAPEAGRDAAPPPDPAGERWNIKRVVATPGDPLPYAAASACGQPANTPVPAGCFVVFGDGPASLDSRAWGFLPADRVLGVVLRRLSSDRGSDPVAIR